MVLTLSPPAEEILFDPDLALRFARVPTRARGYERMRNQVSALAGGIRDQLGPRARIGVFPIERVDREAGRVSVRGRTLDGPGLARRLEGCDQMAGYVATLGADIDAAIERLRHEDLAEAFLLDAVASAYIQQLQDMALERIGEIAQSQGCRLRPRHAPGYHGWPLSGQAVLLDMLDAEPLGVRLTAGFLMLPQKSVSGACGLEPVGVPARPIDA